MENGAAEIGGAALALRGLVWVIGGLALSPLAVVLARRIAPGRRVFFARWGFSHLGAVILVGIGTALVAGVASRPLFRAGVPPILANLFMTAVIMIVVTLYIFRLAKRLDPDGVECLGLRPGGHARAAIAGLVGYALLLPAVLGLGMVWPWLMTLLELEFAPQDVVVGMLELSGPELALAVVAAVLVIPLLEELIFRGFLQPLLVQNLGDRGGLALTSAVFAALHGVSAFLPIFGLSLVLGATMLRTQRLTASWAIHAAHNGLMLALLFVFPETRDMLGQET